MRGLWADQIDPTTLEAFLESGFRRSGKILYQPVCSRCRACQPLRIEVRRFVASRSQRRILGRNSDLAVSVGPPQLSKEKLRLYQKYVAHQHPGSGPVTWEDLDRFLYNSPCPTTLELTYRDPSGQLLGVGICDVGPTLLSSVYFYWEPLARRRSLGVFSALMELEYAAKAGLSWYHLGYWVENSSTMSYKAELGDFQLLAGDGRWHPYPRKTSRPVSNEHID